MVQVDRAFTGMWSQDDPAAADSSVSRAGSPHLEPNIRRITESDTTACGSVCYHAFATIAQQHSFPADFPSIGVATTLVSSLIQHPKFYGVVADVEAEVVGANFLDERSTISSVGPITVDPRTQNRRVGRMLMAAVLQRSAQINAPGVRLVQAAYHNRSMSLYAKFGFQVRESLAVMSGQPLRTHLPGYPVRAATAEDLTVCNLLCYRVHGHDRAGELIDALTAGTASVVERGNRITGYTTGVGFYGHSVGESDDDIVALIAAAEQFGSGEGFIVPLSNNNLMRWCLARRFRVSYMVNLMSLGLYQQPRGAFLASIGY